ncbi:MAG: sugar phosphate isomerase/epimerase family protein [Acidobacteriota bacterium]
MKDTQKGMSRRDFAQASTVAAGALGAMRLAGAEKAASGIKLGLYSITYLGVWYRGDALSLEQVVQRAKQFGYQGVEIDGKRPHGDPLDMPKARCRELRKFAQGQGIEIYAVAGNNDFSSPIPEFREAQLLYMRELIRMSADLEAKIVRVFLAWPGVTRVPGGGARYDVAKQIWEATHKEFSPEQTWEWCREGLRETAKYASDFGVTLALQNHAPVIKSYPDMLRMIREVDSPNLKACFDARLEHELGPKEIVSATREVGPLQVLSHYGNEYSEQDGRIVLKEDENITAQVEGLMEIGYNGYLGFELCHPLPVVNGQLVGLDYADRNARLAAQSLRDTIAEVKKKRAAKT